MNKMTDLNTCDPMFGALTEGDALNINNENLFTSALAKRTKTPLTNQV